MRLQASIRLLRGILYDTANLGVRNFAVSYVIYQTDKQTRSPSFDRTLGRWFDS